MVATDGLADRLRFGDRAPDGDNLPSVVASERLATVIPKFHKANINRTHRDERLLDREWLREREYSLRASALADDRCCNRSTFFQSRMLAFR
jgi:hypothetical protein